MKYKTCIYNQATQCGPRGPDCKKNFNYDEIILLNYINNNYFC